MENAYKKCYNIFKKNIIHNKGDVAHGYERKIK